MPSRLTFQDLKQRVDGLHPHLTLSSATTLDKPATAVCQKHGEFTLPRATVLLKKTTSGGCPGCVLEAKGDAKRKMSYDYFVTEARKKHGDRYKYPEQALTSGNQDVEYLCAKHGKQRQNVTAHLKGHGCRQCGVESRTNVPNTKNSLGFSGFVARAREVHGDRYQYPEQAYRNRRQPVTVLCQKHGEFSQNAGDHLMGNGCQQCYAEARLLRFDEFVENARRAHGDRYQYPEQRFEGSKSYVRILCQKHGEFEQLANTHTNGCGCPTCGEVYSVSRGETEIVEWLRSLGETVELRRRDIIAPQEIDIWLPEHRLGIEHDGLYYHSEAYKAPNYHKQKQDAADKVSIRLVQIFEDEWLGQRDKVKALLLLLLGRAERKEARKLTLRDIPASEARKLYDQYHLQGFVGGQHAGLFDGEQLVACATVGQSRFKGGKELLRYVTAGVTVVGGLARLVKFLTHPGEKLTTYCDRRWFTGRSYELAGFAYSHTTAPGYFWTKNVARYSRHRFQKHRIVELVPSADLNLTEVEIARSAGFLRIHDAGHRCYVFTRP